MALAHVKRQAQVSINPGRSCGAEIKIPHRKIDAGIILAYREMIRST
jgi:hypothetical protein